MRSATMLLAASFLIGVATTAKAALITYELTGTINQVGTNVLIPVTVGQQIPIEITVDSAYPGGPTYAYNGGVVPGAPYTDLIKSALFDNEDDNGLFQTGTVGASSINLSAVNSQTSSGFSLEISGLQPSANPIAFPATLNPGSSFGGSFAVTEAFSPQTYGYSGTITSIVATSGVPEPATLAFMGTGLLGLCWIRNRRSL